SAVLVRDLHDQPEVGLDHLARGLGVAALEELDREVVLLLGREQREAPRLLHVRLQRIALDQRSAALALLLLLSVVGDRRPLAARLHAPVLAEIDDLRRFGEQIVVVVFLLGFSLAVAVALALGFLVGVLLGPRVAVGVDDLGGALLRAWLTPGH